MSFQQDYPILTVRPYQLLCLICSLGEDRPVPEDERLRDLLEKIRSQPDAPIALRCNVDDQFAYQSPGPAADTAEGSEFNRKRDMDILLRLDLAPGSILPARILLGRLLKLIPSVTGLCGYRTTTSAAWAGCLMAQSGRYEKGHAKGIQAIIPARNPAEMKRDKEASLKDLYQAETLKIRPHILVCAVAQYGDGIRPPFEADNLPEMIQYILKNPDKPITLVSGADWMMCASCSSRVAASNTCVCGQMHSGGLYNEMKDLNVLQALGLTFGSTLKAKELFKLIFERIPKTAGVCALDIGIADSSVWRDGCGKNPAPCPGYEKGRELLMKSF